MVGDADGARRAGRPMKPVDDSLPPRIARWLVLWREVVLEPLRQADPPWTLERMARELGQRASGEPGRDAARPTVSGRSKATLQKFIAGEKIPTRDLVQHLLDLAREVLDPPPVPARVQELWVAYREALRESWPLMAELYEALEARDTEIHRSLTLQSALEEQTAAMDLLRDEKEMLSLLLRLTRAELQQTEQVAETRHHDARKARAEVQRLNGQMHELRQERDEAKERIEHYLQLLHGRDFGDSALYLHAAPDDSDAGRMLQALRRGRKVRDAAVAAVSGSSGEQALEWTSVQALERQHAVAMRAVEHLSEQLRQTSCELADARAEVVRRDGDLARLVEQHAEEIASLRADRVLAEADSVLLQALQRLEPAPSVLPPQPVVSTPETTDPPRSEHSPRHQTEPEPAAGIPPRFPSRAASQGAGGPSTVYTQRMENGSRLSGTDRTDDVDDPGASALTGSQPDELGGAALLRTCGMAVLCIGGVLAAGLGLYWLLPSGKNSPEAGGSSASASVSTSHSPLPSPPPTDPVANIGDQSVNTEAIMQLPVCAAPTVHLALSPQSSTFMGLNPRLTLKVTASSKSTERVPCRLNASRDATVLTLRGKDSAVWRSSDCADGHTGPRWLQLTRQTGALVSFTWDRHVGKYCNNRHPAPEGTYTARATVLTDHADATLTLTSEEASTTPPSTPDSPPTPRRSPSRASTADTSSVTGGSIGGLLGGGSGDSSTGDPSPNASSTSDTTGANGSNGGKVNGSNGGNDGGFFGGPSS
ncbi:hypothetical protein [Streptomyces sp. NPDC003273]|uniref:hypothetical protein n=1 Tax=Streptomyces sp. NPDC003273 TaxID=3364678 RepID=UPI00369CCBEC